MSMRRKKLPQVFNTNIFQRDAHKVYFDKEGKMEWERRGTVCVHMYTVVYKICCDGVRFDTKSLERLDKVCYRVSHTPGKVKPLSSGCRQTSNEHVYS